MSATGQDTTSNSTATFLSALVTGAITFGVYTAAFWVLHGRYQRIFQPRTVVAPESKRPSVLPTNFFGWFKGVIREPDIRAGEMNGPDAYFFVRFLKLLCIILLPYWIITWPVLMAVDTLSPNNNKDGLNKFAYGNVPNTHNVRHVAHLVTAIVLIVWTLFMVHREYRHFLRIRQAYLNSPAHATLPRSRTVMLNNLPKEWLNEERIRELASFTNGTIERMWFPRKVKAMEKIFDARNSECQKLEAGEAKVQTLAAKNVAKKKNLPAQADVREDDIISEFVLANKRPTHRLGLLGLFGRKVDTLEYSPRFIREQEALLQEERAKLDSCPLVNSAFVRFGKQADAHHFAKLIKKQPGARLVGAAVEVVPEDIVWANLGMSPFMRKLRTFVSWAITIFLIIIWAIPVAFVSSISQVSTLCSTLSWLSWICKLPTVVVGIIQGILPPVLISILFMLLPIFLRMIIKLQGEPRNSDIERKLFSRFWLFQIIHGLLIVCFAAGLPSALKNISKSTKDLPNMLASNLPGSNIYFLTFILTNTFTKAAATVSRLVPVVMSKLAFIFRGNTPRKAFQYDYKMDSISLALTWPPIALLGAIAIVYSVIQPIVCGFAFVGAFLLYLTYKYFMIWVVDQPDMLETGGLLYPKALRTIFVSLYIMELLMTGLFFLLEAPSGGRAKEGLICGSIMAAMILFTALFQIYCEYKFYRTYVFLDSTGYPLAGSAERLWPENPRDAETIQPGTLNLDSDLVAQQAARHGEGPEYGNTTGLHARAFDNPATWKSQPTVWIADDKLGIGRSEVLRLTGEGLDASSDYATRDEKGKVAVERGPPDEAWYGGNKAA